MKQILILSVFLFLLPGIQQQAVSEESFNAQGFRSEIKEYAQLLRLPGLWVSVVHDGRTIYQQQEGYADLERKTPITQDTIFWLSSITKTFSAVLMMKYEQEGRLSLDDPLIQYPFTSVGFFPQRIDPNVRLKHVLSHTSERHPGDTFVYHGGRYNFFYGVFESMSGLKFPQALTHELTTGIIAPLGLGGTLAGYPAQGEETLKARIVTPYLFDSNTQTFTVNRGSPGGGTAYPASGLLSSARDLAVYTGALDDNRLLSKAGYERMTAPFIGNQGQPMPYGFGWFTQRFAGVPLHWAYGLGDSDSSLLVRVPDRRLTLIVLSNASFATAPSRLGGGNALRSPFVISFLKHFVLHEDLDGTGIDYSGDIAEIRRALDGTRGRKPHLIDLEELFTQALTRAFVENTFNTEDGQAKALARLYYDLNREAFTKNDPSLIYLLSQLTDASLDEAADLFIRSYNASGQLHPWILHSIAKRFEGRGDVETAMKYYHILADTDGFEEQGDKIEACSRLAKHYTARRDFDKARRYVWNALIYARQAGYDDAWILKQIEDLNRLSRSKSDGPGEGRSSVGRIGPGVWR